MKREILRVRDVMTTDVITFTPETSIRDAMEGLSTGHLSGAPVVSGEKVVGVVSITDILAFVASEPEPESRDEDEEEDTVADSWDEPVVDDEDGDFESALNADVWDEALTPRNPLTRKNVLEQHSVEEVMTRDVFSLTSSASVREAASMMGKHGIHRVVVVDAGALVGIISSLDIARAVSEKGLRGKTGVKADPCADKPSPWIEI
jgi:CBS domain-containing protein